MGGVLEVVRESTKVRLFKHITKRKQRNVWIIEGILIMYFHKFVVLIWVLSHSILLFMRKRIIQR